MLTSDEAKRLRFEMSQADHEILKKFKAEETLTQAHELVTIFAVNKAAN